RSDRMGSATFLSGKTRKPLFSIEYPELDDPYGITVGLGDIDGDGLGDVAIGAPNFHIRGVGDPGSTTERKPGDIRSMTLKEALSIESDPWCAFTWESGCALIYSGRDRTVITGIFGHPGSREGVGLQITALPDISGDGFPDLAVLAGDEAWIVAGPG